MTQVGEPVWVTAGSGYVLALDRSGLVCRDEYGQRIDPVPQDVLATREYPAWALVHHPEDVAVAFDVAAERDRLEVTSPKAARAVEELAERLPVAHRPVFLEGVARALVPVWNIGWAARQAAAFFAQAREVERSHELPVDAAGWLAAHHEFADRGAIGSSSVAPFVAGLEDRFPAEVAFTEFVEFAVSRIRRGAPPWAQLPKQIARLARAAGHDVPSGPLVGRIGGVALRAIARSTRPGRRDILLAFLEMWAATPLSDPSRPLRRGIVETTLGAVVDSAGFAVQTSRSPGSRHRFVELRAGAAPAPSLGEVIEVEDVAHRWGAPATLLELVTLARERGPVPFDPEAVAQVCVGTGLSRSAAALVMAGIPGVHSHYSPLLDRDEAKALSVSSAEAVSALPELNVLSGDQRLDLLADVLPSDPAALWQPGAMRQVAERVVEGWRNVPRKR